MKKIVLCFDGTWNKEKARGKGTNVLAFYRSLLGQEVKQIDSDGTRDEPPTVATLKWYDEGVGTKWWERIRGGTFGYGLSLNIRQGYKVLIDNYVEGDEIYLFGFSRGAYTARSLGGLIGKIGLLGKQHAAEPNADDNPVLVEGYEIYRDRGTDNQAVEVFKKKYGPQDIELKFVGVWDTVGALGLPFGILNDLSEDRYAFHDTTLGDGVGHAYHAVAIDEHREDYKPTLWDSPLAEGQSMEQVWFVGAHSDVGGGSRKLEYSDISLRWMQDKADLKGQGLEFDQNWMPTIGNRHLRTGISETFKKSFGGIFKFLSTLFGRPRYLRPIKSRVNGNESIHQSALDKIRQDARYKPENSGIGEDL